MMNESTENYSSTEIHEELRKVGSSISINGGDDGTEVSIRTLKKNLDRTLLGLRDFNF